MRWTVLQRQLVAKRVVVERLWSGEKLIVREDLTTMKVRVERSDCFVVYIEVLFT